MMFRVDRMNGYVLVGECSALAEVADIDSPPTPCKKSDCFYVE